MTTLDAVMFSVTVLAVWLFGLRFWGRHQYRRGVEKGMEKATDVMFRIVEMVGGRELAARVAWLGIEETQQKLDQKGRN